MITPKTPQVNPAPRPNRNYHQHGGGRGFVLGSVIVPQEYGYYGDVGGVTANGLYKRYLVWFTTKYGTSKKPLSFSRWLVWAKNQEFFNASGPDKTQEIPIDKTMEKVKNTGKQIGFTLAIVASVVLILAFAKTK